MREARPRRLDEARYLREFCLAVHAQLDPNAVCATAAASLYDYFGFRLAVFSFASEAELTSVSFIQTHGASGSLQLAALPMERLTASASQKGTGWSGSDIRFAFPAGLGELRLYQTAKRVHRAPLEFLQSLADGLAAALGKAREPNRRETPSAGGEPPARKAGL